MCVLKAQRICAKVLKLLIALVNRVTTVRVTENCAEMKEKCWQRCSQRVDHANMSIHLSGVISNLFQNLIIIDVFICRQCLREYCLAWCLKRALKSKETIKWRALNEQIESNERSSNRVISHCIIENWTLNGVAQRRAHHQPIKCASTKIIATNTNRAFEMTQQKKKKM